MLGVLRFWQNSRIRSAKRKVHPVLHHFGFLRSVEFLQPCVMESFYATFLNEILLCLNVTPRTLFLSLSLALATQQKASASAVPLVRSASQMACARLESVNSTAAPVLTIPIKHQFVHRSAMVGLLCQHLYPCLADLK